MLRNFERCVCTYLHRKELVYKINKASLSARDKEVLLERAKVHDMDKMVMYLVMSKADASAIHKKQATHHMDNAVEKTREDRLEAIFDYESSVVKPNMPVNAYDVVRLKKQHLLPVMLPLLSELGMAKSYPNKLDAELEHYIAQYLPVTEQMILDEIFEYMQLLKKGLSNSYLIVKGEVS